ncbi:hypothetical protein CLU96_4701 [Chryseobacterium sp. 52]|uniref:transposase n=1 Tax=Chryseobacterium sp. 52 TaxID=2035213 RepID=UPI000C17C35F|nr:transposase [Chryseobacterium sp. 52]PIF47634.1 hypothetical protein CLU96_4701 [Chryseobacterium sp. 52]
MENQEPDYKRIFTDIISRKYPHKEEECQSILKKRKMSTLDIIKLNILVFGVKDKETFAFNQRHRFYSKSAIVEILDYQKRNNLNNTEVAAYFKLSRNSVAKWKKNFLI